MLDEAARIAKILPVLDTFRLGLAAVSTTAFKLTLSSGQVFLQLEAVSLDLVQAFVTLTKLQMHIAQEAAVSAQSNSHKWVKKYRREAAISSVQNMAASSHKPLPDLYSNPFIVNENFDVANLQAIKELWTAKQLRKREAKFSSYTTHRLFTGTWNINGKNIGDPLTAWFSACIDADIFILSFQEFDLTTEAFLQISPDTSKEDLIAKLVEDTLLKAKSNSYIRIASRKLVGIFMLIYAKRQHFPQIHQITSEYVTTGILGMMGNKGGVAIRFKYYDSFITCVNSHLAADTSMIERRNSDYQEICRRMTFPLPGQYTEYTNYARHYPWVCGIRDAIKQMNGTSQMFDLGMFSKNSLTIFDTDHLFWMGDLNYRLSDVPYDTDWNLDTMGLLQYDQLNKQKETCKAFCGFEEAPITFVPTYKYDIGTSDFDTSEKKRMPAWCDRILFFRNPLKPHDWTVPKAYNSCMSMESSDHKPVNAIFDVQIRKVDLEKYSATLSTISQELDRFENEAIPVLSLDTTRLNFMSIKYLVPKTQYIVMQNTGKVVFKFKCKDICGMDGSNEPWCTATPASGALLPGAKMTLQINVLVHAKLCCSLNMGDSKLTDILVIETEQEHGKDYFVEVHGDWVPTCFGCDIGMIVDLIDPIQFYTNHQLLKIFKFNEKPVITSQNNLHATIKTQATFNLDMVRYSSASPIIINNSLVVPKELWRLSDFIFRYGMDIDDLFCEHDFYPRYPNSFSEDLNSTIRESLDSGNDFDIVTMLTPTSDVPDELKRAKCIMAFSAVFKMLLKSLLIIPREHIYKFVMMQTTNQPQSNVYPRSRDDARLFFEKCGISTHNLNCFMYIMSLFDEIIQTYRGKLSSFPKGMTEEFICLFWVNLGHVFSVIIIGDLPSKYLKNPLGVVGPTIATQGNSQSTMSFAGMFGVISGINNGPTPAAVSSNSNDDTITSSEWNFRRNAVFAKYLSLVRGSGRSL